MEDDMKDREEPQDKTVDEAWKEAVAKEKSDAAKEEKRPQEITFALFINGLMMEALVALGEIENPASNKKEFHPEHAKFIIDTLSMLKEKTKNNLTEDESNMLEEILYALRMKYVSRVK